MVNNVNSAGRTVIRVKTSKLVFSMKNQGLKLLQYYRSLQASIQSTSPFIQGCRDLPGGVFVRYTYTAYNTWPATINTSLIVILLWADVLPHDLCYPFDPTCFNSTVFILLGLGQLPFIGLALIGLALTRRATLGIRKSNRSAER